MDPSIENTLSPLEKEYLTTLSEKEKHAYAIAKDHLGSSFDLSKSNGFLQWKATKESSKTS
jgi:hypothetical protein